MTRAKMQKAQELTADSRRFTQIRFQSFHRRGAEVAENFFFCLSGDADKQKHASLKTGPFAQSSSPDWAKNSSLSVLCVSAVSILIKSLRAWRLGAKIFLEIVLLNILSLKI